MKQDKVEELLISLKDICQCLGWEMSFNGDQKYINGMIIGTPEFIETIFEEEEEFDGYETYDPGPNDKGELH